MARLPRICLPGYPHHITQRGNDKQDCFFEERDYKYYLECLADASSAYRCDVHAYVLMTNHVHLLLTPSSDHGMSRLMQSIGRKYVRMINNKYERTGTLWDGRYRATVVDSDEYLLACYRYIELNPVRAGMVSYPEQYPWSSYRAHVGLGSSDLLRDHAVYLMLGHDRATRSSTYSRLCRTGLEPDRLAEIRTSTLRSRPLGDERFQATVANALNAGANSSRRRVFHDRTGRSK